MFISDCIEILTARRVPLDPGLTVAEILEIERRHGFEFSPDHRQLLETAQPAGARWLHWRNDSPETIRDRLSWPLDGLLFDVEHDAFWPTGWGTKPESLDAQKHVATLRIKTWPTLVPLYSHRYMPAAPAPAGAPVFSVWQSDVIFYGDNLLDYLQREFGSIDPNSERTGTVGPETCPPWSVLAMGDDVVDEGADQFT